MMKEAAENTEHEKDLKIV